MARHGKRRANARHRDRGRAVAAQVAAPHRLPEAPTTPVPQHAANAADGDDDPGRALRAARAARGLSLEELTRRTKINATVLLAIEDGTIEKLPAPVFTRGFLKAYAREVGLPADATADDYLARITTRAAGDMDPAPAHALSSPPTIDVGAAHWMLTQQAQHFARLVVLAAVAALVSYLWSSNRESQAEETAMAVTDAGRTTQTAPATAPPPVSSSDTVLGPMQFELRPQGPCWLSANVDGRQAFAKLLQAGEHQVIDVRDELVMRIGDPSALIFSINGKTGRLLGRPGEPINVRITKDNYRDFLSS